MACITVYNDECCLGGGGGGTPGPPGQGLSNETVQLPDNLPTRVPITSMGTTGVYKILVQAVLADGANATFDCSKSHVAISGQTERVTNSPAITNERIMLEWLSGANKPSLYHAPTKTGGVGALLLYKVTFMKIL